MDAERQEILRYLGRRGQKVTPELTAMLDKCMLEMRASAMPRSVKRTFGIACSENGIRLENTEVTLSGVDLRRHLAGCESIVLFAATLGVSADNIIRARQSSDMTEALILDACATCLIEAVCDGIEEDTRAAARHNGLSITTRYSPGYGDFPLGIQRFLLAALDAERKIGLTCTENDIMLPRKSVTAVIGIREGGESSENGCGNCSMNDTCDYRVC